MKLSMGPSLEEGIKDAVKNAGQNMIGAQMSVEDIAKQLTYEIAKAIDPNSNPKSILEKYVNGDEGQAFQNRLGAYLNVFKLGLDISFSGVVNQGLNKNFTAELIKFIAPEAVHKLEQAVFSSALSSFRPWND